MRGFGDKISHFVSWFLLERGREERKRVSKLSFDDPRSSVSQNSLRQELKFITSTRATRTYQKGTISSKIQRRRFREIKYSGVGRLLSHATMLQEVRILPTWFISNLRAILRVDCCVDAPKGCLGCVKMALIAVLWPVLCVDLWLCVVCPKKCFRDCLD